MRTTTRMSALAPAMLALALTAGGTAAQDGPPAGVYTFVPAESDRIDDAIDRAVAHMNFLIRPIARSRLRGANRPVERIEIRYPGDSVWISLQPDEPPIVTPRSGEPADYRRADGEVVKASTAVAADVIEQFFDSADGDKRMVYRLRPDGLLALEVTVLSEKLREPFTYTWVYRP